MTILEAITRADTLRPNICGRNQKVFWLSQLDGRIRERQQRHEGQQQEFSGYDPATPPDTALLVEAPYDAMYVYWLMAQTDLASGEIEGYNSAIALFNTEFDAWARHYGRTYMPRPAGTGFVF